jgi:peptide/nickel transport system ATP-binding protein
MSAAGGQPGARGDPGLTGLGVPGPLLRVRDLRTHFFTFDGVVKAVDGISFDVATGRTLGVVGESGCGKSVAALTVMRLIDEPGRIVDGSVLLSDVDLLTLPEARMRDVRGNSISMIFQEPMTSLNPVLPAGSQVAEAIRLHENIRANSAMARAVEMLGSVGIPDPGRRARQYPHEMSGGMRQRVMIAMALVTQPRLLIADEPTTSLDVTIQAQILDLMSELRHRREMSIVLITHDLGVIAEMADDVVVMYCGRVVESCDVMTAFDNPHHPYTLGLLASLPRVGERRDRLSAIEGTVPDPLNLPDGCHFARRCPFAMPVCSAAMPPLQEIQPGHLSRCWLRPDGTSPGIDEHPAGPGKVGDDESPSRAVEDAVARGESASGTATGTS